MNPFFWNGIVKKDKGACRISGSESESPEIYDLKWIFVFQEVVWRFHELQQEG
jgi:hypothetical protein